MNSKRSDDVRSSVNGVVSLFQYFISAMAMVYIIPLYF